ncbi:MAG: hypothetical protein ACFFCS_05470 [Candidatus Hodarchaeota archaeon]
MEEKGKNPLAKKLIILVVFIGIVIVAAMVDWAAEHPIVGTGARTGWLFMLISLGIVLPIVFMYFAGNETIERKEEDRKWFIWAGILFAAANGIPVIFYVVLGITPGYMIFLQLGLMGLFPAFMYQPKKKTVRLLILLIIFALLIVPLGILVNFQIDSIWAQLPVPNPTMEQIHATGTDAIDKTMYYMFYWGLLFPFIFMLIAMGWKFGGGKARETWNIFVAGMILQYSAMEDFLYFFLNGQNLPTDWYWLENFVINLMDLFGPVITSLDLLVYCSIMCTIVIFVLLDGHGFIWNKIKQRK